MPINSNLSKLTVSKRVGTRSGLTVFPVCRFLCYHGGDLATANDVVDVAKKSSSTLSNAYFHTACTPQDSPSRNKLSNDAPNSPAYSEADLGLKSLIYLQRSLAENHQILQDAIGPADGFEHLRFRSMAEMKEMLEEKRVKQDVIDDDTDARRLIQLDSQFTSDIETELGCSNLSLGNIEDSAILEMDETDHSIEQNCSTIPQASSSINLSSRMSVLSSLEVDDAQSIDYVPVSHIKTKRKRLPYYLCCGYRPTKKTPKYRTESLFTTIVGYMRRKLHLKPEVVYPELET